MNIITPLARFFSGLKFKGNIYVVLLLRLGLAMLLFSVCRIGFYLFNAQSFPTMALGTFITILLGGLRFDLTAVLYTNLLFILLMIVPFEFRFLKGYQQLCQWLFYFCNGIALTANVADFIYYRFTGRRTTADVFQQFENENNLGGLFFSFLWDYWYAILFLFMILACMIWLYKKIKIEGPQVKNKIVFYSSGVLAIPLIIGLVIAGGRGGFLHSTRPITLNDAGQYVKDPSQVSIVLNTPFAIYRTLGKTKIQKVNYFSSEEELEKVYSPVHNPDSSHKMKKLNVVIIILESFSKEFIGFFNQHRENGTYQGYTPFLDSLAALSKTYKYSFANGRKSIDGLPSVVASIPSMGIPYVLTAFSGNRINSLGNILKREGYHTSFFHGAPNGSMGFSSFMNLAGIDHYYGMGDYFNPDDYDGLWGIWDHKFFRFWTDHQKSFQQPFFSVLFSVSSHHPFKIPTEFEGRFKGGHDPMLKCVQYTDYALREYFKEVSKQDWYANTIFVITADHISSQTIFADALLAKGRFAVPIIFFRPDNSLGERDLGMASQIDIMPKVLNYLGYDKKYIAFGGTGVAWNIIDDVHHFYQRDYLLKFDGQKAIGLYDFKRDSVLSTNLLQQYPDTVKIMERKIKAIIQQYNNRMVENRLDR